MFVPVGLPRDRVDGKGVRPTDGQTRRHLLASNNELMVQVKGRSRCSNYTIRIAKHPEELEAVLWGTLTSPGNRHHTSKRRLVGDRAGNPTMESFRGGNLGGAVRTGQ